MRLSKIKKRTLLISLPFLISIILAGYCWPTLRRNQGTDSSEIRIGLTMATFQEERWKRDKEYLAEKITHLGGELISLTANNDPNAQLKQVEYLINQKIDVLIIIPQDLNQAAEAVEIAKKAGVKVISYDRLIRNADLDLYISFDNVKVGELMAERLIKEVPSGRYVIINGAPTDNNCYMINQGFKNVLNHYLNNDNITIVYENWADDWLPEKAYGYISHLLHQGNSFDAVIAGNDGLAGAVIEALSEWRLAGKIPVTGHDADLSGCQRIIEGTQLMTVYKPIRKLAYRAAELAMLLAKDIEIKTNHPPINNGKHSIPAEIIMPISIDKANMNKIIEDGFHRRMDIYRNIPLY